MTNPNLDALASAGTSAWLDDLSRQRLDGGELKSLVDDYAVVGVTTNPAIFSSAMTTGDAYDAQLRELAAQRCEEAGIEVRIPPIRYCTDNGAMIAALGSALIRAGVAPSPLDLAVDSSMPLSLVSVPA